MQLGVALIGAGPWGATLARTFERIPGVNLRWICDLDDRRRAEAAVAHPAAAITADVDEVLADPDVAAAVVAVDAPRHHAVGLRVLGADRHVLVEKPLALSVSDAAALCEVAAARARLLTVGHLLLHHPAVQQAKQLIHQGALGTPFSFESTRTVAGTSHRRGSAWWALAPHDISLALHLFESMPTAVSATSTRDATTGRDLTTSAILHFDDGRLAHIQVARFVASRERRFSVAGSDGVLSFNELDGALTVRSKANAPVRTGIATSETGPDPRDALFAQCLHFASCAARGDTSGGNAAHALSVVRILEAGDRSRTGCGAPIGVR